MQTEQAKPSKLTIPLRPPLTEAELLAAVCVVARPILGEAGNSLDNFAASLMTLAELAPEGSDLARRVASIDHLIGALSGEFERLAELLLASAVDRLATPAPSTGRTAPAADETTPDVFDLLADFISCAKSGEAVPVRVADAERQRLTAFVVSCGGLGSPAQILRAAVSDYARRHGVSLIDPAADGKMTLDLDLDAETVRRGETAARAQGETFEQFAGRVLSQHVADTKEVAS